MTILHTGSRMNTPKRFNYQRLRKYAPRLEELRRKGVLSEQEMHQLEAELEHLIERADIAEAQFMGASRMVTTVSDARKARRFTHIQEEAKPLVDLRADLKQHLDDEFPVPPAMRERLAALLT